MKHLACLLITVYAVCLPSLASAATRYVNVNNASPASPYASWATAARTIQDAIDGALAGDLILVTNGIYQTGARLVYGMSNRVAVTQPVTVQSVNGSAVTTIAGYQLPGAINGAAAVRCVYLTNGAVLSGFTLTNGATQSSGDYKNTSGGAVWCESTSAVVTNCTLAGNLAYSSGGGAFNGTLNNCTFTGNSVTGMYGAGGGSSYAVLNNCTLTGNSATGIYGLGGGAYSGTLNNCTLTGNLASDGGGVAGDDGDDALPCTLNNCTLSGNSAAVGGGGVYNGTLNNCTLTGNSANSGGGAISATLNNCALRGNSASWAGGGALGCTLNNCTLTGNSASDFGGGAFNGTLNNCIVYYNTAGLSGDNYYAGSLNYCCTAPLPNSGSGNFNPEPQLADNWHLIATSPCRARGSAAYATGLDLDGEPWANPPSVGCDEYWSGPVTGAITLAIQASYTNVAVGFAADFQGLVGGRVSASRWDFGDGVVVSNRPSATHAWSVPGDYVVELRTYNESYPAGVAASVTVHVVAQPVHYVVLNSATSVAPYTSWATAAANIQDAMDAATVNGALVLVSNGVYQAGAVSVYGMSNRLAVTKPITVQSFNGPEVTTIVGYQVPGTTNGETAVRCVYLTNRAVLSGFTLTNGATQSSGDRHRNQSGGGVWGESASAVVTNCVLAGNSAFSYGGGAYAGTVNNCTLIGNSASEGGGAYEGTLNNCALTGNSATGMEGQGGGASRGTLKNCTLMSNSAPNGGGASSATLNNCTLTGNSANSGGGGVYYGTVNNCTLTGNSAGSGGGAFVATLNNCALRGNSASRAGGGAYTGTLNNCTLTGDSADYGGGAYYGTLNNCIVYYNTARLGGDNYYGPSDRLNYCCTTPLPSGGSGNFTSEPQLAGNSHLSAASPCRGVGSADYIIGLDRDGEAWANPPSVGCDEYWSGSVTGAISVAIQAAYTNIVVGFAVDFQGLMGGPVSASRWDFGDGVVVSNQPYATHAWSAPGDYVVELRAYNESNPGGVAVSVAVRVAAQPVHYVSLGSVAPVPPYSSWATAANNIQDAVDVAVDGDLILVTNGVYQTGAREVYGMSNRVAVTKQVIVQSFNGPGVTTIAGYQVPGTTNGNAAVRCVYLTNKAVLSGFTLTNGATQSSGDDKNKSGGAVWCESAVAVVTNCVLAGNSAYNYGGATYYGTLNNCTLTGNSAAYGGGASFGMLNHCTLTGNSASNYGGGAVNGTLNNCNLNGNSANFSGGGAAGIFDFTCTLNNCTLTGNSAYGYGGAAVNGTLNNCTLTGNSATNGGGTYYGTLNNCTLAGNSAYKRGGGAHAGTLNNCTLSGNSASEGGGASGSMLNKCTLTANSGYVGGGALFGTLNYCTLTGNSARYGGGAVSAMLNNCTISGNSAIYSGGGALAATLNNCVLTGNSAQQGGGAAGDDGDDDLPCTLNNCTLSGNSAQYGGGAYDCTLNNCIVYYNTAPLGGDNYYASSLNYCCTIPLPSSGSGNFIAEPQLAANWHLSTSSPCRGAGSAAHATGLDLDGEPWANPNPPSVGCDEYWSGSVTGAITLAIQATYTNVAVGFGVNFLGPIGGRVTASRWDFGDGVVVSNQLSAAHAWSAAGDYVVELRAWNESHPDGVAASLTVHVVAQPVYYVMLNSATPVPPYTSWPTAATNIQDAVDAAVPGALVLVSNGVYQAGVATVYGMSNRVAVTKAVTVQSVNGPEVTAIVGYQVPGTWSGFASVRCVYLTNGAVLSGFTLTNGAHYQSGGGVWCESASAVVTNCILTGNSAPDGGGAYYGTLNNCTLAGNSAQRGGGANYGTLNNCTLTGNSAQVGGGGAYTATLNNCALMGNLSSYAGGGASFATLSNCTLSGNSASWAGGGAAGGTLNHCTLSGNSASEGGGAYQGTLNNCLLTGNSAQGGGGVEGGRLNNCTLAGNSADPYGGGAYGGTLNNCIVYYNSARTGANYFDDNTVLYNSCTTPLPRFGTNNITKAPQFVNTSGWSNLRLSPTSPCINAGINQDWMLGAVDLDGNARIINGTVDMGAYETPFTVNVRVFLQGPYSRDTHSMVGGNPTNLPTISPYAADPRQVASIPSNVVDWVLVELRGSNGSTIVAKSAFLDRQAQILSAAGSQGITAEISAGYYSIVVKHRNHLAVMSAQPVAFTNYLVTYDFTTGADKYSGGSNAAAQLEPGAWGMIGGDTDGDGEILAVDAGICTNQLDQTGYLRGDFNLDGTVSSDDLVICTANQGRTASAINADTRLTLALTVSPGRKTLLAGDSQVFTVSGASNTLSWALVKNPSGGTLTSLNATSALYQAGSISNSTDIIEAWDAEGRLGRAYVNVISPVALLNPRVLADGSLAMTLQGSSNRIYSILGSTNLLTPAQLWTEVSRLTNTAGQSRFTNPPPTSSPGYFRAKEL